MLRCASRLCVHLREQAQKQVDDLAEAAAKAAAEYPKLLAKGFSAFVAAEERNITAAIQKEVDAKRLRAVGNDGATGRMRSRTRVAPSASKP
eukprot:gene12009-6405_t